MKKKKKIQIKKKRETGKMLKLSSRSHKTTSC